MEVLFVLIQEKRMKICTIVVGSCCYIGKTKQLKIGFDRRLWCN